MQCSLVRFIIDCRVGLLLSRSYLISQSPYTSTTQTICLPIALLPCASTILARYVYSSILGFLSSILSPSVVLLRKVFSLDCYTEIKNSHLSSVTAYSFCVTNHPYLLLSTNLYPGALSVLSIIVALCVASTSSPLA